MEKLVRHHLVFSIDVYTRKSRIIPLNKLSETNIRVSDYSHLYHSILSYSKNYDRTSYFKHNVEGKIQMYFLNTTQTRQDTNHELEMAFGVFHN